MISNVSETFQLDFFFEVSIIVLILLVADPSISSLHSPNAVLVSDVKITILDVHCLKRKLKHRSNDENLSRELTILIEQTQFLKSYCDHYFSVPPSIAKWQKQNCSSNVRSERNQNDTVRIATYFMSNRLFVLVTATIFKIRIVYTLSKVYFSLCLSIISYL